ncbi:DUF3592 domain-containing protein [bacterium]|nr:DUF3592 domain-containing protein [bacterium]
MNASMTKSLLGPLTAILLGLVLLVVGGRLVLYQRLLAHDAAIALAEVVETGSVRRSSGGTVGFITYRFQDADGDAHGGRSTGYTGEVGETVRVEYSRRFPSIHRLGGEGDRLGTRWRWVFVGVGLMFTVAGVRWLRDVLHRNGDRGDRNRPSTA